jgi:VRR-NUC domain-containing protein
VSSFLSETSFRRWVVKQAREREWAVARFTNMAPGPNKTVHYDPGATGFPDLTLVREVVLFVELKHGNGRLRPEQVLWLRRLRDAGAEVDVWRSDERERVLTILDTGSLAATRLFATEVPL